MSAQGVAVVQKWNPLAIYSYQILVALSVNEKE